MEFEKLNYENPTPLYRQFSDIIVQKIKDKEIAVGDKLPTQNDLCQIFKISEFTVKEGLSHLVKAGYISRRPSIGTFVINSEPVKAIDLKIRNEVGVVLCLNLRDKSNFDADSNPRHHNVLIGIEEELKEMGMYMVYSTTSGDFDTAMIKKDMAGLVLAGGGITPRIYKLVEKSGIPFVLIGDVLSGNKTGLNADVIADDDFQGTYIAAKHLTGLGHKNIAIVTTAPKYEWDIDELNGYKKALEESGIGYEKQLQVEAREYSIESARQAMKQFLDKNIHFTGLVNTSGEALCYGALEAIREKGMKIPEDVSVVCKGASIDLTLSSHDFRKAGRAAVERLLERINDPRWKPGRIVIPPKLTVRNSTRKLEYKAA